MLNNPTDYFLTLSPFDRSTFLVFSVNKCRFPPQTRYRAGWQERRVKVVKFFSIHEISAISVQVFVFRVLLISWFRDNFIFFPNGGAQI